MKRSGCGRWNRRCGSPVELKPDCDNHTEGLVARETDWRVWFYRDGKPGDTPEAKKKAFQRAKDGLLGKGLIASRDDFVWPKTRLL